MDVASATRASGSGPIMLRALDTFPAYKDSNGYTYALAARETDGAVLLVYVRGDYASSPLKFDALTLADIVELHNERARLTHERNESVTRSQDESAEEDERTMAAAHATDIGEKLKSLPRTRAQATVHVARALTHWERATDTSADSPAPESESESEPEK